MIWTKEIVAFGHLRLLKLITLKFQLSLLNFLLGTGPLGLDN